jgi:hypothetical protein
MADRFAMRDKLGREATPHTFETIENELERLWAALKRINTLASEGGVQGPDSSNDGEIVLFSGATGALLKAATGTGVVHATLGVYSVSDVDLASEVTGLLPVGNLALDGDATHVLFMDGTMRAIVAADIGDFAHRVLSAEHSDSVPAVPEAGALIVGQTSGETVDAEVYWLDGEPAPIISGLDDPGADVYWIDGEPLAGIGFSTEGRWAKLDPSPVPDVVPLWNGVEFEWVALPAAGTTLTVVYVAGHGSDANDGLNLERPKLTIGAAITAAAALITGGQPRARVEILDAGTYTETLTISANVIVIGRAATLVGTLTLDAGAQAHFNEHYAAAGSTTMVEAITASGLHSFYSANILDGRGTGGALTNVDLIRNGTSGRVLFTRVGVAFVPQGGIGVRDATGGGGFGHIHCSFRDLYLAGNNAQGMRTNNATSNLIGYIDHVLEISAPTGTVAFDLRDAGAVIKVTVSEVIADEVWNISAGDLYITCPKLTGTRTGTAARVNEGDVVGPASAVAEQIALFDGTTGKLIKDSGSKIEVGTWTPTVGGTGGATGVTYGVQLGSYVKIGKMVLVQGVITLTNKGTITGSVRLESLPFASANITSLSGTAPMYWESLATNWVIVIGIVAENSTNVLLRGANAADTATDTSLVDADLTNTTQFVFTFMYRSEA